MTASPPIQDTHTTALISAEELAARLAAGDKSLRLLDATYGMPGAGLDAETACALRHIDQAVFFDIDHIADPAATLPHMIPDPARFERCVAALGISNDDTVVVYDQGGIAMAACRAWWMFRLFGHDNVRVLDGGLPYWLAQGLPVKAGPVTPAPGTFKAAIRPHLVKSLDDVLHSLEDDSALIIDARAAPRYAGTVPEPRAGLRCGHIPGSINIPFMSLLAPQTGRLKPREELRALLAHPRIAEAKTITTSCGSGVTACVVALALYEIGHRDIAIYDGSWTEWGQESTGTPVATAV